MSIATSLSGFPEWLPAGKAVELDLIDQMRRQFELHGFIALETRSVEPTEVLLSKGETDKEIYALRRLQAQGEEEGDGMGLHFDLTVPTARYIKENQSHITFPFRRYQIQKAWRGERPGLGRFREFLQADIDIISHTGASIWDDMEILDIAKRIFSLPQIPPATIYLNNRKTVEGFCRSLGISSIIEVMRVIDKLPKIGAKNVREMLISDCGLESKLADECLRFAEIKASNSRELLSQINMLCVADPLFEEGISELAFLLEHLDSAGAPICVDMSIMRGLDYYTGSVFEVKFSDYPDYPTVSAGGRYDKLITLNGQEYSGVGISFGITRILSLLLGNNLLEPTRITPSVALVALIDDQSRYASFAIAETLRSRGIACEVYPVPIKLGKQIRYADKLGIPYVWFPPQEQETEPSVKDIRSGDQMPANPQEWTPPEADARLTVVKVADQ